MKRNALILAMVLVAATRATAAEVYAAYQTLTGTGGIAMFDADTLELIRVIPTDLPVSAVALYGLNDGGLLDIEGNLLVNRYAATGAIINTTPLPLGSLPNYHGTGLAANSASGDELVLQTNNGMASSLTEFRSLNDPFTHYDGNEPVNNIALGGPAGFGAAVSEVIYGTANDHLDAFPVTTLPGLISLPVIGPTIPNVLGVLGHVTVGSQYVYAAFGSNFGSGVAAFDPNTAAYAAPLSFLTPSEPRGLAFGNGSLFDSEFGQIIRRDPTTGTSQANSSALTVVLGDLAYSSAPLSAAIADYNHDGIVDAADYTLWRDTFGQTVTSGTGADGNGDGIIDSGDYGLWKLLFGTVAGAGSSASTLSAVPEPSSVMLAGAAALILAIGARRRLD